MRTQKKATHNRIETPGSIVVGSAVFAIAICIMLLCSATVPVNASPAQSQYTDEDLVIVDTRYDGGQSDGIRIYDPHSSESRSEIDGWDANKEDLDDITLAAVDSGYPAGPGGDEDYQYVVTMQGETSDEEEEGVLIWDNDGDYLKREVESQGNLKRVDAGDVYDDVFDEIVGLTIVEVTENDFEYYIWVYDYNYEPGYSSKHLLELHDDEADSNIIDIAVGNVIPEGRYKTKTANGGTWTPSEYETMCEGDEIILLQKDGDGKAVILVYYNDPYSNNVFLVCESNVPGCNDPKRLDVGNIIADSEESEEELAEIVVLDEDFDYGGGNAALAYYQFVNPNEEPDDDNEHVTEVEYWDAGHNSYSDVTVGEILGNYDYEEIACLDLNNNQDRIRIYTEDGGDGNHLTSGGYDDIEIGDKHHHNIESGKISKSAPA